MKDSDMIEAYSDAEADMFEEVTNFKPIRRERVSLLVEKQIKEAIFRKRFPVGTKLPTEREFADKFHVSRTSVREAFRSLERSGFISIKKGAHGGAFISKSLSKHVVESMMDMFEIGELSHEDILQARLIIEPSVAAEATKKATAEDIALLKETNRKLREGYKTGDPGIENNPRIHRAIAEITNNKVILIIMRVLMDLHTLRMRSIKLDDSSKERILRQHEELIEAMDNKDSEAAFEIMKRHIIQVHDIHTQIEEKSKSGSR